MAYFSEGARLPRGQRDWESGDFYYGARYYDPKISVWLSVDPLMRNNPSVTPYNFTGNNPVMNIDPDGLDHWRIDGQGNVTFIDDNCDDVIVNGIRITDYNFDTEAKMKALAQIMNHYASQVSDMSKYPNSSVSVISYSYNGALKFNSAVNWGLKYKPYENRNDAGMLFAVPSRFYPGMKSPRMVVPLENGKLYWLLSNKYNIMNAFVHEDTHEEQNMSSKEYSSNPSKYETEAYHNQMNHPTWNNTTFDFRSRMYSNFMDYNITQPEHKKTQEDVGSNTSHKNPRFL